MTTRNLLWIAALVTSLTACGSDTEQAGSGELVCPSNRITQTDISAGQGQFSGEAPSALIDSVNAKLLVVSTNYGNFGKPALFQCNLDGTGCNFTDISSGQGNGSGRFPSAVIDSTNAKLLVVTTNDANCGKPALFQCNLDGTGCNFTDISSGQAIDSGYNLSAVIDSANAKLLVVTRNDANFGKPALFRCNLDGAGCTYTDISAGQGTNSGRVPSAVIDSTNASSWPSQRTERTLARQPSSAFASIHHSGCRTWHSGLVTARVAPTNALHDPQLP
ncbi:MAG TPA: hypothetical protein VGJ84_02625 [Polyangiaceae bacterium]